jgi:hypothetical protein
VLILIPVPIKEDVPPGLPPVEEPPGVPGPPPPTVAVYVIPLSKV